VSGGRKKKQVHEEHENHERWLVSWADFMTLLFAFFVVMYAVSRVDTKRVVEAEQSVRWAMHFEGEGGVSKMAIFDGPPSEGGPIINMAGGGVMGLDEQAAVEDVRRRVENRVRPFVMQRSAGPAVVAVVVEGHRVTVRLAASEFFDPGQAALRPQALPVVDALAQELVPLGRPIAVEGHTDETPVSGARWRDNWDLSAARAATVVSYLQDAHGASPPLLSAVGRADTRPAAAGDDEASRELNRRVELILELDVKQLRRKSAERAPEASGPETPGAAEPPEAHAPEPAPGTSDAPDAP
jgi:chemotaxis protein MotB